VRITLVTIGGTIAEQETAGRRVHLSGAEILLKLVPGIDHEVEVVDLFDLPSNHLGFPEMLAVAQAVRSALGAGADAVVVTHGTDTLEETAYFVDLLFEPGPTIVFTAAMLPPGVAGFDGENNLNDAFVTAGDTRSRDTGVLVVMAGGVHTARDVVKHHSMSLGAFKSLEFGPLGTVDEGHFYLARRPALLETFSFPDRVPEVEGIKCYAGMTDLFVRAATMRGLDGLVIETLGSGQVPPGLMPSLREAVSGDVVVVATTRCPMGRLKRSHYGAPVCVDGDEGDLREAGIIFCDLSGTKARIKLQLALAANLEKDLMRLRFECCGDETSSSAV